MDQEKEDRISSLPDDLLLEIISLIKIKDEYSYKEEERLMSTREVIKTTCLVSKRWQHLWTLLPNLVLAYAYRAKFFEFIHKTITQCSAMNRKLQEVTLETWDVKTGEFSEVDELFFNNSCINRMRIWVDELIIPPNGAISWDKLKFLYIRHWEVVDGDSIGKILSGSPCLETLELDHCYGARRIDVTSKSIKNLVLTGYGSRRVDEDNYIDTLEINAPFILSLTIKSKVYLEKLLLLNVSSLVKADLDYLGSHHFSDELGRDRDDIEEDLLRGLLLSLGHVNEITLGDYNCLEALSRLEDKGFQFRKGSDLISRDSRGWSNYRVFSLTP